MVPWLMQHPNISTALMLATLVIVLYFATFRTGPANLTGRRDGCDPTDDFDDDDDFVDRHGSRDDVRSSDD